MSEPDYKEKLISREAGKAGFRGICNAKCIECIYDPIMPGTWRKQVEECTATTCPIYPKRATSSGETA